MTAIERCERCGANLAMVGRTHRCIPKEADVTHERTSHLSVKKPSKPAAPKRKTGRPRIGEVRERPWEKANPPMSKSTWYRRQAEQREKGK